ALPDSPEPVGVLDSGLLAAAVAQVAPAASRDDTLPMLTAVCLDVAGDVMTLAATDRYRLAARDLSFAPSQPERRSLALVPAKIMVEVARTFRPGVPVTVAFGTGDARRGSLDAADQPRPAEGLVSFDSGDRRLTARLIGGEFIRYRNRFGDDFACPAAPRARPLLDPGRPEPAPSSTRCGGPRSWPSGPGPCGCRSGPITW